MATNATSNLKCPHCAEEGCLRIDADDFDSLICSACEATCTREKLREMVVAWTRLLARLDALNAVKE